MKLDKMQLVPETAEVQKAQRRLHYSVTPIGDKQALAQWKAEQATKEVEWQKAQESYRLERRKNAEAVVRGDKTAAPLSDLEMAEIEYRQGRFGPEAKEKAQKAEAKYAKALTTYRSYEEIMGVDEAAHNASAIAAKEEKLFSYQTFRNLCSKLWRNAFDSER